MKKSETFRDLLVCVPKHLRLAPDQAIRAARLSAEINPMNFTHLARLTRLEPEVNLSPLHIAMVTKKYWGAAGVRLGVGFLDNPPAVLKRRILSHMNAWGKTANVRFSESTVDPQVRISRSGGPDGGYWSYVGTDILQIRKNAPTMNLESFTMGTSDSEFVRVVRHETGHTLGFPHEHMRAQFIAQLDVPRCLNYFETTQGWSEAEVRAQVLTPLEESSLMGSIPDAKSIMCYQIPGTLTKTGRPIVGGLDISANDYVFASKVYPQRTLLV